MATEHGQAYRETDFLQGLRYSLNRIQAGSKAMQDKYTKWLFKAVSHNGNTFPRPAYTSAFARRLSRLPANPR